MRSTTFPGTRWARSTLVGGLVAALTTLVFIAPANADIIGTNDLKPIPNTTALPYSAVVEITIPGTDFDGVPLGRCTGWMYAPNMVATAGHCIYNQTAVTGGWFDFRGMTAWPGINGSTKPFPSCGVVNAYVPSGWTSGQSRTQPGNEAFDYGALRLDCTVGDQTGMLNYGLTPTVGYATRIVGYPHNGALRYFVWATLGAGFVTS